MALSSKPPQLPRRSLIKVQSIAVDDGSLNQKELGFIPLYDLKTVWGETIRGMRESCVLYNH